jgi:hypothetical protein
MKCANHPREDATYACYRCANPICNRCAISKDHEILCPRCAALEDLQDKDPGTAPIAAGRNRWIDLTLISRSILLFLLLFGILFVLLGLSTRFHNIGIASISVISALGATTILFIAHKIAALFARLIFGIREPQWSTRRESSLGSDGPNSEMPGVDSEGQ